MIRFATEQDIPAILTIYNHAILHTTAVYSDTPRTLAEQQQWFNDKQASNYPIIVVVEDDEVAGFASYGAFRPYSGYRYTVEHSIYVSPNHQRKGFATILLNRLLTQAAKEGYKTMVGGIDAGNTSSIKLHEKLGFSHAGTIHNVAYKFENWLDLSFYELALPGPKQ